MTNKKILYHKKIINYLLGYILWGIAYKNNFSKYVLNKFLILLKKNVPRVKVIHGQKLLLIPANNIIDLRLDIAGTYEPHIIKYFFDNLREGMTFMDIGANNGIFSLIAANLVGENGKVYSFEPNPSTFKQLSNNIALNNYKNIFPYNIALWDHRSTVQMSDTSNSALNSMAINIFENIIDVDAWALDDFLEYNNIKSCDFVIMDIEGAEYIALNGMKKLLSSNNKLQILIELHPQLIEKLGGHLLDILTLLKKSQFSLYTFTFRNKLKQILIDDSPLNLKFILCKRN